MPHQLRLRWIWALKDEEDRVFGLLKTGPNVIGRYSNCDIVVEGDDQVSNVHATFTVCQYQGFEVVLVVDNESANGTWVNCENIAGETEPTLLRLGDRIFLGRQRFRLSHIRTTN